MSERSGFQRFLGELRRRHVPQTAAVYMVAAWAAIEFADVVVPNLGWSDRIVTAVIVAAAVGLPVVLVLAWIFDWGPEGMERTPPEAVDRPEVGRTGSPSRTTSGPWVTALSVLVVGVTSALAVAVVLDRADGDELADEAEAAAPQGRRPGAPGAGGDVPAPPIPELPPGILSREWQDSITAAVGDLSDLERLGSIAEIRAAGERFGSGRSLLIAQPSLWMIGSEPAPLAAGDTLRIQGVARDSAGVVSVAVDGRVVAEAEGQGEGNEVDERLPFATTVHGTGSQGIRVLPITIRTADGREIVREYRIQQVPGG